MFIQLLAPVEVDEIYNGLFPAAVDNINCPAIFTPFNVVIPLTFNVDTCVEELLKVIVPDTYNELFNVVILFNIVVPDTYNELLTVVIYLML